MIILPLSKLFLQTSFFTKSNETSWKDETINHSNIYYYYLSYSGARKAFCKEQKEFWFVLYVIMCETKYLNLNKLRHFSKYSALLFSVQYNSKHIWMF